MRRKLSLRWLIPLAMVSFVIPTILVLSFWHYEFEHSELIARYRLQGKIAMGGFQGLVEAGLIHGERETLKQAVRSVAEFPCFSRALGIDSKRRVFLSSAERGVGERLDIVEPQLAAGWPQAGDSVIRLEGDGTRMAVYHKLPNSVQSPGGRSLAGGWLFLELDLRQELAKQAHAFVEQSLASSLVVFGFSFMLWIWLSRRVTAPLTRMTQAVGRVAAGSSGLELQESCCAELAELARGFTLMDRELATRLASLKRQRMLYRALSETNQSILRNSDETTLLVNICEAAVKAGLKLVWIGYLDKRSGKLSIVHTAGGEAAWLETVRRHVGIENDPMVQLAQQGEEGVVVIGAEKQRENRWYAEARLNGFAIGASFPITRGGSKIGALGVMSDDPALFVDDGLLLLREMANDIGFALDNLDRDLLRREMEKNLAQERGLLRTLVDTIPDVIFFKDRAQNYLGCNQAFEELVSIQEAQLVGGCDRDLFPPQLADAFYEQDERILTTAITERDQVWMERPDGRRIRLDFLKAPYLGTDGVVIGLVGIGRDITAEFQAKQELQRTLQFLQDAERISNIGTWAYDPATREMHWSQMVYRLLNLDPQTTVPDFERLVEHCRPEDRRRVLDAFEALQQGRSNHFVHEYRVQLPDGNLRYLIGRGSRCEVADQAVTLIGTMQDVTPQKLADEERRQALESVHLQQQMAVLGELASGVLHDLNDVFTPVLGYSQLATGGEQPSRERLQSYLRQIGEAAERGKRLLRRLTALMLSRPHLPRRPLELPPLSDAVVVSLQSALPAGIRVEKVFAGRLPKVLIDAADYQRIVLNLALRVSEAIGEQGVIRLTLRTSALTAGADTEIYANDDRPCVELRIEGMGEERRADVPGPRSEQTPPADHGGLSLRALSLLLQLYEGRMQIDSIPGEVVSYRLLLPAAGVDASPPPPEVKPVAPETSQGKGRRVLLVDDEEAVLRYLQEFLRLQGFEVEAFTRGQPALERLRRDPVRYDLLITDQLMPGVDGLQLIAEARRLRQDLPVILSSGYSEQVSISNAQEYGVDRFLQKPVSLDELMKAVNECLRPDRL